MIASTTIMTTTEIKSQIVWLTARFGESLVTMVIPIPESTNTIGRMAGSAAGARNLIAM